MFITNSNVKTPLYRPGLAYQSISSSCIPHLLCSESRQSPKNNFFERWLHQSRDVAVFDTNSQPCEEKGRKKGKAKYLKGLVILQWNVVVILARVRNMPQRKKHERIKWLNWHIVLQFFEKAPHNLSVSIYVLSPSSSLYFYSLHVSLSS